VQRKFLFLLGSARRNGNTEQLARHAAGFLPANAEQQWLSLMDLPLPPFEDIRHSLGVYPAPMGHEKTLFEATLEATDIVFVTPLYWYSVSYSTKHYLDYWSAWMRVPDAEFKKRMAGKTAWLISANSDENGLKMSEHMIGTLQLSAEYMGMSWGGQLIGYGNRPGDVLNDEAGWRSAAHFFAE
jgi:multimeric flavodoxin WrbA